MIFNPLCKPKACRTPRSMRGMIGKRLGVLANRSSIAMSSEFHNDHAADKRCEASQFLHHVGDFSTLGGILYLEHLTVVSARQDEHHGTG